MDDNFKTTENGLRYIFYKIPVRMDMPDSISRYKDGGALVYVKDRKGNGVRIIAYAEYIDSWTKADYIRELDSISKLKRRKSYLIEILQPVREKHIITDNCRVMSKSSFYDINNLELQFAAVMCEHLYGDIESNMTLFVKSDKEHDGIAYFGYTMMKPTEEDMERLGAKVTMMPYSVFKKRAERAAERARCLREYFETGDIESEDIDDLLEKTPAEIYDDDSDYEDTMQNSSDDIKKSVIKSGLSKNNEPAIVKLICRWISATSFSEFCRAVTDRVMGQEATERIALNIYNYLECLVNGIYHNNNMLLAAPSGCGKTETFRAVRDYFAEKIPELVVYQIDMTSITEEGFKGQDTSSIVEPIRHEDQGVGIVFLDEFDKKLIPSFSSSGSNVNLAVQSQILTLIEGRMVYSGRSGDKKKDTRNTLFIAMGAFDECRKKNSVVDRHMGFEQKNEGGRTHYADISREDMIGLGASYELIGRFADLINYHELTESAVDSIIDKTLKRVSCSVGCSLKVSDEMRALLHKNANSHYGCRILESIIRESTMSGYLELKKASLDTRNYTLILKGRGGFECVPAEAERTASKMDSRTRKNRKAAETPEQSAS